MNTKTIVQKSDVAHGPLVKSSTNFDLNTYE